jgi:hypothetical protein
MNDRKTISASECTTWLGCSLRHKFHYIDKVEDETRGGALVLGSTVHTALGAGIRLLRSGDATPDNLDVKHLVDAAWSAEEGKATTPILWGSKGREASLATALGLVEAFFKNPQVRERIPRIVELELKVELPLVDPVRGIATGIFLKGYLDAVEETGERTPDGRPMLRVLEFKTSASKGTYDEAGLDQVPLQVALYKHALQALRGDVVVSEVGYMVGVKTKAPEWVLPIVPITAEAERRALLVAQHVARAVQLGVAVPSPSWQCPTCPHVARCATWGQTAASPLPADPFAA